MRRVGYRPDSARVAVAPGCAVRLEAYLSRSPNSLFPLALTPARFTLSTCAPGAERGGPGDGYAVQVLHARRIPHKVGARLAALTRRARA